MSDSEKHVCKLKEQGFPPGSCRVKTDDKHDLACRAAYPRRKGQTYFQTYCLSLFNQTYESESVD